MVQRKTSKKILRRPSEPRNGGGRREGEAGGDLMKMQNKMTPNYMMTTTSSDARTAVQQVTMSPNYMKPATSSDARQQVTTSSLAKPSNSCTLRPYTNKPTKATCSSTLKNSKFTKALELHPGVFEAQGTSAMRVCPYNYCSLNGHWHEPLPPLKSVMSAGRKLFNTQKRFKHKGMSLFKVKGLLKDEKEIEDDFFVDIYDKVKESQDVDSDRCTENNARKELENKDEYFSDIHFGNDLDKNSELSVEEIKSMLSLLEYVECDWKIESKEENQPCLVPEGIKPVIIPTSKASGINSGGEEGPIPDNKANYSESRDDVLSPMSLPSPEKETTADALPHDPFFCLYQIVEEDTEQLAQVYEKFDEATIPKQEQNLYDEILNYPISSHGTEEEDKDDGLMKEPRISPEIHTPSIDQSDDRNEDRSWSRTPVREQEEERDVEGSIQSSTKQNCLQINEVTAAEYDNYGLDNVFPLSDNGCSEPIVINDASVKTNQPIIGTADGPKSRTSITRKTTTKEQEQMKEFNPRSPRFLEIESDPEAEKVDLRHHMIDDRKNAEEWMIDYALQRVVSNLEPARKKKVALLVKAFETIKPLSMSEERPQYATSPE